MNQNGNGTGRSVVVTGMGIVTTSGETIPEFLDSIKTGRSGITQWKRDSTKMASKIGGDMSEFDILAHLERVGKEYPVRLKEKAKSILRATPLAANVTCAAALQAYLDAGLPDVSVVPERTGSILGGTNFNSMYLIQNAETFKDEPDFIEPLYGIMTLDTDVVARISELLTLKGPIWTVGNACGSGNIALINGLDLIRSGRADAVVVTAGNGWLDPVLLHNWAMLGALSTQSFNDEPWRASRPFDRRREGFVPSEGAAAVVLESRASAEARHAKIHAELLGGASAADALWNIRPLQDGQVRAMRAALEDAHIRPEQVDYVNAHATSTPIGDLVEISSIKSVFGEHVYDIPVNATKSMTGHLLNAAAMVEMVATILQMQHSFVHPTINLDEVDPELDLDFVPGQARECDIEVALSNSFGFGGLNSSVVVRRTPQ
jgi:3-oxoacyl-(acyl-carrier-protein) synthase